MLVQLLEAALRTFALGGAVWLSLRLLRVQHPQARMTAWTVVLAASLAMPVLMHWATLTMPIDLPPSDAAVASASPSAARRATAQPTEFPTDKAGSPASENADAAERTPGPYAGAPLALFDWQTLAMGLYLAVGGGLLLRLVIGLAVTWRLLRRARRIVEEWTEGSDVRASVGIATPVTFAATILLPAEWPDWSPTKRQAVLAHERSHIVRGDFLVLFLATLHRAVFWFSPFSWWLLTELAETAELVSDDAAIDILGDRVSYAEILLGVARSAREVSAGIAMAQTRNAVKRVERILALAAPPPRLRRGGRALIAMSLVPLVALTTISFSTQARPSRATSQAQERQRGDLAVASATAVPALWLGGGLHLVANQLRAADASDMFDPAADWNKVAGYTSAVQLGPGIILTAQDEDLKRAFHNLAERHIALALEFRALVRTDRCPQRTKAYSDPGDLEKILERMHRLGADLQYAVLDDPFFFGHRFSGPGACREPPEELARQIAEKIRLLRSYFPHAQIGTADVVDESKPWIDDLAEWVDVYQRVVGEPLAFFHADVGWSRPAMRNLLPLAKALQARHIRFGITYNGDEAAGSDEAWFDSTRQHIAEIESGLGMRPDDVIFRSWAPYPSHLLPETHPGTLTGLALQYLLARPSVILTCQADVLSGQMLDPQGHPVASANLTVDALDVAGSMDAVERHLAGKVPPDAATAIVGIMANVGVTCICAGEADASVGTISYREGGTGRREEIAPFRPAERDPGSSVRVIHLVPGTSVTLNLRRFPVTPGADYDLDVPLSVSANGERAGYVALMFLNGAGRETRRDRVWFRPSVRSLGNAVTNADGRFQMEIPVRSVEAGSEIRAYFPGSASLGSQTVVAVSQ
jgi:beta-lactamase regulating signal transducer with metallopeptidase domain